MHPEGLHIWSTVPMVYLTYVYADLIGFGMFVIITGHYSAAGRKNAALHGAIYHL